MTDAVSTAQWVGEPLIMGTSAQFAQLRAWLNEIGFTEAGISAVSGVESLYALPSAADGRKVFLDTSDPLSLFVQLYLDGTAVPWDTVNATFKSAGRAALGALGLLQSSVSDPALCVASVAFYVIEGTYFVSDRLYGLQITGSGLPADLVFSGLTPLTHQFVARMPRIACSDYLELCSGTGIAALLAAREFADHAWAVDITQRSTQFATFNALLNGLTNVSVLQGDLYEPVLGRSFDLITAHPPYMPSFDNEMVYRDGGEDGEQITRAIIEGLPRYLRAGGQFLCECMMSDRKGARLEQRIRAMLGESQGEFDVIVAQSESRDPVSLFGGMRRGGAAQVEQYARHIAAFERLEVEAFVAGQILIQRRKTQRAVGTRRRIIDPSTTAAELQWLLHYTAGTAAWGDEELAAVLDARPRCLPRTELHTESVLRDGAWAPTSGRLVTTSPFVMSADCPPWFPALLAWCDGTATVRELFQRLIASERISNGGSEMDFARLIFQLADAPFIELPQYPLPPIEDQHATAE